MTSTANKPNPEAPFTEIWDWFYDEARLNGFDVDTAEDLADRWAAKYAR